MPIRQEFHYQNIEQKRTPNGRHITRKVAIYKNGKGYKSITTHLPPTTSRKSRRRNTVKKPLTKKEIAHIIKRKFIPGLFRDCHHPQPTNT